jgi:hypothetical protein
VELVDEQDDLAVGGLDLLEHGLEALLEFAAVLGAGDEGGEVELEELAVLEALGDVAAAMRRAMPSAIAVLPTPGSPISTGLFLVRRDSTWIARRISTSRPITGSSF